MTKETDMNEMIERVVSSAICRSWKYDTGEGTCAVICMEGLGNVRSSGCQHRAKVHGKLTIAVLTAIEQADCVIVQREQATPAKETDFTVGDAVRKPKGYPFNGFVVAAFVNRAGAVRYVVEHKDETGMLHIYSASHLELRPIDAAPSTSISEGAK